MPYYNMFLFKNKFQPFKVFLCVFFFFSKVFKCDGAGVIQNLASLCGTELSVTQL